MRLVMLSVVFALTGLAAAEPPSAFTWVSWKEEVAPLVRDRLEHVTRLEIFRLGLQPIAGMTHVGTPSRLEYKVLRSGDWKTDLLSRDGGSGAGVLAYPILRKVDGSVALAKRLVRVLSDGRFGQFNKFCGPLEPAIGYRFWSDNEETELLVCFHCAQADLVSGENTNRLQIDLIVGPLLELALETFPDDPALLAERARRSR